MSEVCKWKPLDCLNKQNWLVHGCGFHLPSGSETGHSHEFVYCPFCGKKIDYLPFENVVS